MQSNLRCAIYTRVSTDNQAEIEYNSCTAQEEKIKSFIDSQENMSIYKTYSDPGFTGANLNRPALIKLLNDIRQEKINLVIAYKIDRLTRSPKDFYQLIELFDAYGVDFISVTERFDTSTPSGRLLRNIMLTFAQFERELASERTKDKMIQRVQKGMWNGGLVPFGYKSADKKLAVNGKEAKVVRKIYEDYLSGTTLSELSKNSKVYKSRIYIMLRNPLYAGKIKYAGKLWQGNHRPIISEEVFHLAQSKHKKLNKKLRSHKNCAFGGLLKCKECGSYMTPCHTNKKKNKRTKRYYYYRCTTTFKKDWNSCRIKQINSNRLDNYIIDNLERISFDKQYIDNLIFSLNSRRAGGRIGLLRQNGKSSNNPLKTGCWGTEQDSNFLKLAPDSPKISAEIFAQTLSLAAKSLQSSRGIEKNILAKKFLKSIKLSKKSIEMNLFYQPKNLAGENKNTRAESTGLVNKKNAGSPGRTRTCDKLVTN
ncbi:MAG: recombinase family protein [Candidatus Omnitrophica bacterium]|nr:recombinase family protein [Candidatus Omnitrophota bacterium]